MTEYSAPPWSLVELAVRPKRATDQEGFALALAELAAGDPSFQATTDLESGQTVIGGTSESHLDEKLGLLRGGYGIDCVFGSPQVSYRETIAGRIVQDHALERRTDAGVQSARVRIAFEPDYAIGPCRLILEAPGWPAAEDRVRAVEKGIRSTTGLLLGAPIVQIRATLMVADVDGPGSPVAALEAASRNALREALLKAGAVVLEPVMRVDAAMPDRYAGAVTGDLKSRRGRIQAREIRGDVALIVALVPLANLFGYAAQLLSLSEDRASFTMAFASYEPQPPRTGGSPPPATAAALRA